MKFSNNWEKVAKIGNIVVVTEPIAALSQTCSIQEQVGIVTSYKAVGASGYLKIFLVEYER